MKPIDFFGIIEDTLSDFGNKVVGLIRLDSGFYQKEILDYLENMPKNYIVAVRFTHPVQQHISEQKSWFIVDDGIEICDSTYQAQNRDKPRRVVIVRQKIAKRPNATGKQLSLFPEDEIYRSYRYSAYVTNLEISALDVWSTYRARGDAENRIKELKQDFDADELPLKISNALCGLIIIKLQKFLYILF